MFDGGDGSGVPSAVIEAFEHLAGVDVDACDQAGVREGLAAVHRLRCWVATREGALSRRADALSEDGSGVPSA